MDTPVKKKISLINVSHAYRVNGSIHKVIDDISFDIPHDVSFGLLGRNGAGKSTMMQIISGLIKPNKGRVEYNGLRTSWPVGKPALQTSLSGIDNIKFFCRLLNMSIKETKDFIDDFSELGKFLYMPVNTYSSGMRTRLGFAISMAAEFDTLLVDEGFNAGDARFTQKMNDLFEKKREKTNMICVSHNGNLIKKLCNKAGILQNGKIQMYDDVDEALDVYKEL